jgi:hypothetical protein
MLAKLSVTATCDSHNFACLDHLGRRDTDRIISIYVELPKVAKASRVGRALSLFTSPIKTRLNGDILPSIYLSCQ